MATIEPGVHARSLNSIYRQYGVGRVQKVRDSLCKVKYNPTVFSRPPHRSINYLQKIAELEVCPPPLELAKAGRWDESWKFDLRQMAARFLTLNKGGQLSNARTEILPHQIFTAFTVVSSPRRRFRLADEVGLGKTIEAGMVWQALLQRGNANRTLIITPAGLTRQWQEEFKDKFQADDFEIFGRDFTATNPRTWDLRARAIASLDRLKRKEHKRVLLENRKWDLIIFDEAHRLSAKEYGRKTDKTQNYQLAEVLRDYTDALLLLTATPHAGDPDHSRFINLVRLLESKVDFSTLVDQPLFREPDAVPYSKLILRTPKLKVTDAEGNVVFKGRLTHPLPFGMYPDEKEFYDAVEDHIRTGYNSLEQVEDPMRRRAVGFILTPFQKLNASSVRAIKAALEGRLEERYKAVTFDRATAIRNPQTEFFSLGHCFVDALLQQVGDYGFGGHTAVRAIEIADLRPGEAKAGYQFNFIVRGRVRREDGDEYLFSFYTVVISAEGLPDEHLASWATSGYSKDDPIPLEAERLLCALDTIGLSLPINSPKTKLSERPSSGTDLIGVAKVAVLTGGKV